MKLQFLGAAGIVTGSCFLLDTVNARIMIECGMYQGPKEIREYNYGNFQVPPSSVDHVLLTHAHIDHSGLIPKLVKHGYKGKVIATAPTVELCEVLLPDSGFIQEMEVERKNRKNRRAGQSMIEPIYTVDDAYRSLSHFKPVMYDEIVQITPDIRARFVDAGHILGSAMIELWVRENESEVKLVFSGDIGNMDMPIVKDPSSIDQADYVIMESTYGSRLHDQQKGEMELLYDAIRDTYQKGGNLIIPAFAVERTQDLIYHLYLLMEAGRMPPMQVYIDSPLATAATAVFWEHRDVFDRETTDLIKKRDNLFRAPGIKFTRSVEESRALNSIDRAVIISASGMCEAGRIRHHLKYNLWRPESTVLFVGYQAQGSLGRLILDGAKSVRILGDEIAVKADIRFIEGYSAHADQAGLVGWVKNFTSLPREIFLVHGEPESLHTLAALLRSELGAGVTVPKLRQTVDLVMPTTAAEPADPIRSAYISLTEKIEGLLRTGTSAERRGEILRLLAELESTVDRGLNKAAGQ